MGDDHAELGRHHEARQLAELERRHDAEVALQTAIEVLGVPSVLRRIASHLTRSTSAELDAPF